VLAAETRRRIARIALGLNRAPSGRRADLDRIRRVVAGASSVEATAEATSLAGGLLELDASLAAALAGEAVGGAEALGGEALRGELDDLIAEPTEGATALPGIEAPYGYDVAIRSVPFRTSTIPLGTPDFAAGRAVERTIGPVRDASGRDVWIDILLHTKQVGLMRGVGGEPFLLFPVKGLITGGSNYTLTAGTVWIKSTLLAPAAPAGAYCGIRISGGRLRLTEPGTVAGGNLVIGPGTTATLDIDTDQPAATGGAGTPGADGHTAKAEVPKHARFVFGPLGGQLTRADKASMAAFGTDLDLTRRTAPGRVEPLVNRVVLPFDLDRPTFEASSVKSKLFSGAGEAPTVDGGWALAMTIAAPSALGEAAGAGGLLAEMAAGLEVSWRGTTGRPIPLARTIVLTEPGRVAVAAERGSAPGTTQLLRLWNETGEPADASQVQLTFPTGELVRLFSEASLVDAVFVASDLNATVDRPLSVDGRRVPLRSTEALVALWQLAGGFGALILANVTPKPSMSGRGLVRSIALTNALIHVSGPTLLLIAGTWPDPEQIAKGVSFILFGVRRIIPSLRDPYATNLPPPITIGRRVEGAGILTALLIAHTSWPEPTSPTMALILAPAPFQNAFGSAAVGAVGSTAQPMPTPAPSQPASRPPTEGPPMALAMAISVATEMQVQDAKAEVGLRQEFESVAGNAREHLVLVDVSSNVDQFGVGFGIARGDDEHSIVGLPTVLPIAIEGLDLSTLARNLRVVLLPQFQWEPVVNLPNPLLDPYPSPVVSADDGGPTVLGTNSVTLVPFAPKRLADVMLDEYRGGPEGHPLGAKFTLPFGMKAAAHFQPFDGQVQKWATVKYNRPGTDDQRYVGGLQIAAYALPDTAPGAESPSFPGATWQTRNLVSPTTGMPLGLSVLRESVLKAGVEDDFNGEMGPGGSKPRVPVTRIDFSGYGASLYSSWANPNAIATTSQVRFDVVVGRTAYEVVQIASVLYPWAVQVVRTITLERRKEGAVFRFDSGWVAKSPGLYDYPDPDPGFTKPTEWTQIRSHPGVVRGAHNVRRIRETGRIVTREYTSLSIPVNVVLAEVKYDADFDIDGVVQGAGAGGLVTSRDQVGFVQRSPDGYTLLPEHLAEIMDDEGPFGGPVDCVIDVGGSGQLLTVKRVDVAPAPQPVAGGPQFAAAARGAVALPSDGQWSVARHVLTAAEPEPVNAQSGVPLIRKGLAPAGPGPSDWYRIADPADLLRESTPAADFGLVQGSEAHRVFFPRPRIKDGNTQWSSTQKPVLAEPYTLSTGVGNFPPLDQCLRGAAAWGLDIGGDGRFTLLPAPTMQFDDPLGGTERLLIDGGAFKVRMKYEKPAEFKLDPSDPTSWGVGGVSSLTTMDLGPFENLIGVRHGFASEAGKAPGFVDPEMIYPPELDPIVEILEFLATLLGIENVLAVEGFKGSFKFKATLTLPIENPHAADRYIDLGAMEVKGKLSAGVASAPAWSGFIKIELGARVPVIPPIMGGGEVSVELEGSELTEQKVTIEVKWSASIGKSLGPIEVKGSFTFGIQVIAESTGAWQIGLLVAISASADIWIAKITIKVELLAAIKVLGDGTKEALGQAKFAAEIEVAWFLTVSVEYSLEYKGEVSV
jgi:hypothetical protein